MFAYLKGKAQRVKKDKVILDVNNVGYLINIPEGDAEKIISMGDSDIKLNIYTDIKENDISLYGFLDSESLSVFEKLIKVSGVGSKMARGILSFMTPQEICIAIANEDSALLTGVSGVGGKTAARIILELKDKILKEDISSLSSSKAKVKTKTNTNENEALLALKVLGYSQQQIAQELKEIDTGNMTVEDIIKKVLHNLNRG